MQSEEMSLNVVNVSAVLTSTGRSFHYRGARTESSREQDCGWVFQHDNDPKHMAKATKEWLKKKHIKVL